MDIGDFAMQFDADRLEPVHSVSAHLTEARVGNRQKAVRSELYTLDVYGPVGPFKSHVDTPHRKNMFGSLVVVFPTQHEGGTLLLRHGKKQWTFDSANLLSEAPQPSIAYVAFYSDVEHEILPVTSGYRVTLTYNLYFADSDLPSK
ncbi:hypothetical protein CERSUDRAFT_111780 [Gelatoporia subvermispora B]|uniref:Prolyl 4-hydroxylase alpha subunit Fe(2+) 2OG dioxygenase domain-containing protein n=1 Tax=Ceriporiopsis subvermispora (strain B) TaxID=914234 RepID=M2QQY8_CERS8|nr:hypothetical protein CERSUDRAFT_111780 [Gelatoporia subvermispora B]